MALLALLLLPGCQNEITPAYPEGPVTIAPVATDPMRAVSARPGSVALIGAWQLRSRHYRFGGYSALLALPGGELLAISDGGFFLRFSPPGAVAKPMRIDRVAPNASFHQTSRDSELATIDPATGRIWVGWESENAITRHDPGAAMPVVVKPPAMAHWLRTRGAEAMVRLVDGRFIVLCEGFVWPNYDGVFGERRHEGLFFPGDPVSGTKPFRFTFVGPGGFSPVDMAQLPDGRVLILVRKLVWPYPAKFAVRIVVADPAAIRPGKDWNSSLAAALSSSLGDNFEGMAIVPSANGKVTVWLISDANDTDGKTGTQRTLLWKLALDPARLP